MITSDPYLLRIVVRQQHEERLREADAERLAATLGGGRRLRRPHLPHDLRLPRLAHGHRRPALH